jgi:hypothetical protein
MSFADQAVLASAANAGGNRRARHSLELAQLVTRESFDKCLKGAPAPTLDGRRKLSEATVTRYPPAR